MVSFVDRPGAWWLVRLALSGAAEELLVIERIPPGARLAAFLLRACGFRLTVRELDFDFVDDVILPDGSRAIEQIYFKTAPVLVRRVEADPEYGPSITFGVRSPSHEPYARAFLAKRILSEAHLSLRSIMFASWYCRTKLAGASARSVLHVKGGWLFEALAEHAERWNVELRLQPEMRLPWREGGRRVRSWGKAVVLRLKVFLPARPQSAGQVPRVAAEMCWNGISLEPLVHTEFFWYRKPTLPSGVLFGYFAHPKDQPTGERQALLEAAGIGWVDKAALRRLMVTPSRDRKPAPRAAWPGGIVPRGPMRAAVQARLEEFYSEYDRWHRFFMATGTRVHVSTYDVFPASEAVHAAIADAGGVSVSIQRSIERDPYVLRRTVTDVHFAFSKAQAERERLSGSIVRQFITAGFPYDDVFEAARARGREIAAGLRGRGVRFILCFFDENDGMRLHRKWLGGQRLIQGDYSFLCGRLEADPALGLVLKPKRAETLAQRLGPVWPRLQRLVQAGRCMILSGRAPDERTLPCVGACAADLSINLLYGGTTGLESYLAGTPALLIRHGVDLGLFERLPKGSVVFDSWEELWEAVEQFRADRNDPRIGNWEPIVEEFASLRDGRGADRINQYLVWLYNAFASGKNRDQALEEAREQYQRRWGDEWITEIRQGGPVPVLAEVGT